jgi:putative heme transporter
LRPVRRLAFGLLFALVVEYLVLPQVAGARKALHLIGDARPGLLLAAFALEVCALLAYAQLTASLLPTDRPGMGRLLRIELSTLAVSHVLPGGSAAGSGIAVDLYRDAGVAPTDAGFALATQGLGSAVVLNALLWLGLVISIPLRGFNPLYGTAAVVGVLILGLFSALILLLTRGEARAARVLCELARRIPFLDGDAIDRGVHHVADRLRTLGRDRALLTRAIGWATANWLLDAAALWACVASLGGRIGLDGLIVAYGLANVVAAVPITPGGVGVMEAVLTASLVGFGLSRGVAILAVIAWRLLSFWLPIPVGAASYVSLKLGRRRDRVASAAELRGLAERLAAEAETRQAWATRHGIRAREAPPS